MSRSNPSTCPMKMTATASYRAVPSMLMVAPTGATKPVTRGSTPLFSSRFLIVTGSVAELQHKITRCECPGFSSSQSQKANLHVVGMLQFISDINQPSLPTLFLFCSSVYFCLYGPFNCISFHKVSRQLFVFSLCSCGLSSALLILSTIYLFMKVSCSPNIIPSC